MIISKNTKYVLLTCTLLMAVVVSSCKKEYYNDGGIANAKFSGTVLDYLDSNPLYFDSLARIVRYSGLDQVLKNEQVTLFAPTDYSIKKLINSANTILFVMGVDTIKKFEDVNKEVWKTYLLNHVFKNKSVLKDYRQLDLNAKALFSGEMYIAKSGEVFNIGVIFKDAGGIKYGGYRQLAISSISDLSDPYSANTKWITSLVSSSDIQPTNGVVHVLNPIQSSFGMSDSYNFALDVYLNR